MIRRRKQKVRLQAMTRMLNYIICNDSDDCMQFLKQTEAFLTNFVSTTRKTKQICAITNMPTLEQNKKQKHCILMLARMETACCAKQTYQSLSLNN